MLPATMLPVVNYATDRLELIASKLRIDDAIGRGDTPSPIMAVRSM